MTYYFFTGAGLSRESGLATFRDTNDGTWSNHDLNVVCNFLTYKDNKKLVFDFYSERKQSILLAQPNKAHFFLADLQKKFGENVVIFTQNVDDLLERAGCSNVIHLHGNIFEMKCYGCGHIWDIGQSIYSLDSKCPNCSCFRAIKPNIIFFNERAPEYAKLHKMRKKILSDDYIISIGTSFNVISEDILIPKKRKGSQRNIQINPILTDERYFGLNLALKADEGLEHLKHLGVLK